SSNPRQQATIHDGRVTVQPVQGRQTLFAAEPGVVEGPITQTVITYNAAYQADDLDAYDYDCDDFFTAKAVLMANLSSYGSDVLSEIPHSKNTHTDMLNQSVQEMSNSEQIHLVNYLANEITGDSNIIPYTHNVIAKETNVISIADSEETLMLEEESRSKMLLKQSDTMVLKHKVNIKPINYVELNRLSKDFGKRFVPQQELFNEQALHHNTDQSASSLVKIEAPRELPK
nr:hypothetical protein [Tanacetum cinerariifolium]